MDEKEEEIIVSAAASLTDAFSRLGRLWEATENKRPTRRGRATFNFASSGALLQQILAGAPVDVFAAASPVEMDRLAKAGRLAPGTRRDFATNRLVLIAPAAAGSTVRDWRDLSAAAVRRVAVSDPETVPSGRYARETLIRRGLWTPLRPKLILGENVRQTLAYVATGNADAGLVFRTDARAEPRRVRIVAEAVPGRDHSPIRYPAAVVAGCAHPEPARRFVAFLGSAAARRVLAEYGFGR